MAKKIVIADLQIEGIERMISDTSKLVVEQERLKKSNSNLKKETNALSTATEAQQKTYVNNQIEIKRLGKQININNKVLEAQTGIQQNLTKALERNVDTEAKARASNTELINIRKNLNRETESGRKAIDQINKKLDENNEVIKDNVSEYEQQKIGIGDYTTGIKEAFSETAGFNGVLGVLQNTFSTVKPLFSAIKTDFQSLAKEFKQGQIDAKKYAGAQKILAQGTNFANVALKAFKIALASTGIGLIVIALAAFVAFLTSTQKGIDAVNSVLIPLKVVFESLVGLLQQVGETMFNAFNNPKQVLTDLLDFIKNQVTNRLQGFGKIIQGVFTFDLSVIKDGTNQINEANKVIVNGIKNASQIVGDTVNEAIERGKEIATLQIEIEKGENKLILARAEQNRIIKEQNKIAEDTTKSVAERETATIKTIEASESILALEQEILDTKIEQLQLEQQSNDTTRADEAELNQLIAERAEKETQALELQTTQQNKLNTIRREAETIRQKAIDKAIKQNENALKLFIAQTKKENNALGASLEERLQQEQQFTDEELDILKQKLDNKRITEQEYEIEVLAIKEQFLAKQAELTLDNLAQELAFFQAQNKTRLEQGERLTEDLVNQEIERLNIIEASKLEILEAQREANLISELEFLTAKANQEDEFNTRRKETKQELQDQEAQDKLAIEAEAFEEKILLAEERDATEFEIKQIQLERDKEIALANAEQTIKNEEVLALAKSNINRKFALADLEVEKALAQSKVDAKLQVLNAVATIAGKESAVGKAVAIAQTTITTYQSATSAFNSLSGIPIVGPVLGGIAAAAAVASGLANVAKIVGINIDSKGSDIGAGLSGLSTGIQSIGSTIPKAKDGGLIQGNSHENGGVLIEAEGNEMIMSKKAVALFLPELQAMQKAVGANPSALGQSFARNGGIVTRALSGRAEQTIQAQELIQDNINTIQVINDPLATLEEANNVFEVEQNANL